MAVPWPVIDTARSYSVAEAAQRKAESNAAMLAEELKKLDMQLASTEAAEKQSFASNDDR